MNARDNGNVRAFVQTAEQIGGRVWIISLVDFDADVLRWVFRASRTIQPITRRMLMEFNNGAVLEALRLALCRQIPWHKRPAIFTSLRSQGLIQTVDQKPPSSAKYLPAFQIAILTDKGQREIQRIEASKHVSGWLDDDYFATFLEHVAST